jgi:hypothetical protein
MSQFLARLGKRLGVGRRPRPHSRPFRPSVEALDSRIMPAVTFHGGPILSHANVSSVFYGQNWNTDDPKGNVRNSMIDFMKDIVGSPYMAMLGEYGVGRGTIGKSYDPVYSGPKKGDTVSETQIQSMLLTEMAAGRIPPGAIGQQLFFVYLAPGVKSSWDIANSSTGHHGSFQFFGATAYYAVIADTNFSSVAALTSVTSHELAEAVTDPDVLLSNPTGPNTGFSYKYGAWYSTKGSPEIGDGLEGQNANFVVNGHTWTVQKEWSNYFGKGIVANGNFAGYLDVPPYKKPDLFHPLGQKAFYAAVAGVRSFDDGGRTATDYWARGWDGRLYHDFVTAAGDLAGTFTIDA